MAIQSRFVLPALVGLAAALRIAAAFGGGVQTVVGDPILYLRMAEGIVNEAPSAAFPNGYPLIIAVFRLALSGDTLVKALLALNVVLSTATVWLTGRIGQRIAPETPWVGLAAAGLLAIYPHQLRYVQLVMSEVPCLFFLTLSLWLLLESDTDERWKSVEFTTHRFLAGLFLHMAYAIRPSVLLAMPILLAAGLIQRRPPRALAIVAAGYLAGTAALFGIEKMGIVRAPTAPDNNLLIAISSQSHSTEFVEFPPEQQAQAKKLYLQFATRQPAAFARQRAVSLWELWGFKSLPGYREEAESGIVKVIIALRPLWLLGALAGLWRNRRRFWAWALFAPILAVTIVHTATFSNHRFLAPIEPSLFLLTAVALAGIKRFRSRRIFV